MEDKIKAVQMYRQSDAISQSELKHYLLPYPNCIRPKEDDLYYSQKKYFLKGDAVDTILTFGKDVFKEKFYINQLDKLPSESIISIAHQAYDLIETGSIHDHAILQAMNDHEYKMTTGDEARLYGKAGFYNVGAKYLQSLFDAKGKTVLSKEEEADFIKAVNGVHLKFGDLIKRCESQVPIYWEYEDYQCKGLKDFVDYENKIIYDLKTTSLPIHTARDFLFSYYKHRYDIQESWYRFGTQEFRKEDGWRFKFIVVSFASPEYPVVFEKAEKTGRETFTVNTGLLDREYLGWEDLLKRWHHYKVSNAPYLYDADSTVII